jgi:hypothetical protein
LFVLPRRRPAVAVVRNIIGDDLSLFRSDGQIVRAGKEVEVADGLFVGRAWPKSTWAVVKKPADCVDVSLDDAHVFVAKSTESTAPVEEKS